MADPVRLTRSFASSPAALRRAWTDPARMRLWWGSNPNGTVLHAESDPRVGGRFRVRFDNGDGTEHTCFGVYQAIDPALLFTWEWAENLGVVETVEVAFVADGTGTLMEFEHADIHATTAHGYAEGWSSTFDKLQRALEGQTSRLLSGGDPATALDHLLSPLWYEHPEALSLHETRAVRVFEFDREVRNGGFDQFFFNLGHVADETLEALRAVGAENAAALLESAIAVFPRRIPKGFAARHRLMEPLTERGAWDELAAAYESLDVGLAVVGYARLRLGGFR